MRSWRWPEAWQWEALIRGVREWLQIYEHLQSIGIALIYIQIACALAGSLVKIYSGVPVAELAVSLFALVAIESGNHVLFRIYLFLLCCSLLIDIFWFILIAKELRTVGNVPAVALRIMLAIQATGSIIRLISTVVWIRIFQQGVSTYSPASYEPVEFDARLEALVQSPPSFETQESLQPSDSDTLAGSIYDPAYYSSLFGESKDGEHQLIIDMKRLGFESSSCNPG